MACLRRLTLLALVWLTAASTLLAGVPHFDCLCPDGQHSSFCLVAVSSQTGCCCGGACCATGQGDCSTKALDSKKDDQPRAPTCCQHNDEGERSLPTRKDTKSGPSQATALSAKAKANPHAIYLKSTGCAKTLSQAEVFVSAPSQASAPPLTTPDLSVPLPAGLWTELLPGALRAPLLWLPHALPPPTDLVIALQHFLI
jgi:hypothetical protein